MGRRRGRPPLIAYASRADPDDPSRVIVGSNTTVQGAGPEIDGPLRRRPAAVRRVVHEPAPTEVFDPSVAVREEAPGWIWLDGSLQATRDGELRLCDRGAAACATGAEVVGIDPATLGSGTPA